MPAAQPMPGVGRAAELLDEAVVAPAAADAALRAERVGGELEDGARVVVEAAHERRVDLVGDARPRRAARAPRAKCSASSSLELVEQPRRVCHHAPRALVVGVERAQRVQLDPRRARPRRGSARARAGGPAAARGTRRGVVGAAEARQAQPAPSRTPMLAEQRGEQRDRLGVDGRVVGAERLGADLPELPVAAGLGALVAEEARQVPELHRLAALVHAVLDVGAADRRGALGAQRQRAPAAVLEA